MVYLEDPSGVLRESQWCIESAPVVHMYSWGCIIMYSWGCICIAGAAYVQPGLHMYSRSCRCAAFAQQGLHMCSWGCICTARAAYVQQGLHMYSWGCACTAGALGVLLDH